MASSATGLINLYLHRNLQPLSFSKVYRAQWLDTPEELVQVQNTSRFFFFKLLWNSHEAFNFKAKETEYGVEKKDLELKI